MDTNDMDSCDDVFWGNERAMHAWNLENGLHGGIQTIDHVIENWGYSESVEVEGEIYDNFEYEQNSSTSPLILHMDANVHESAPSVSLPPSQKPDTTRVLNWTETETNNLIILANASEWQDKFRDAKIRNSKVWQSLAESLKKAGVNGSKAKEKYTALRKQYRTIKGKLRSGDPPPTWPYYSLLKKYLDVRAVENPKSTVDSAAKGMRQGNKRKAKEVEQNENNFSSSPVSQDTEPSTLPSQSVKTPESRPSAETLDSASSNISSDSIPPKTPNDTTPKRQKRKFKRPKKSESALDKGFVQYLEDQKAESRGYFELMGKMVNILSGIQESMTSQNYGAFPYPPPNAYGHSNMHGYSNMNGMRLPTVSNRAGPAHSIQRPRMPPRATHTTSQLHRPLSMTVRQPRATGQVPPSFNSTQRYSQPQVVRPQGRPTVLPPATRPNMQQFPLRPVGQVTNVNAMGQQRPLAQSAVAHSKDENPACIGDADGGGTVLGSEYELLQENTSPESILGDDHAY